jgi:hypothetical protein
MANEAASENSGGSGCIGYAGKNLDQVKRATPPGNTSQWNICHCGSSWAMTLFIQSA